MTQRIAVLASGRGTNLRAILEAIADGRLDAEVVGVFSNKPGAPALRYAPEGMAWGYRPSHFGDKTRYEAALADAIDAARADWVVCAGYMRILGDAFIARFRGRLLNIHPSLLPKYPGLYTHARAVAAHDAEHGASVHFVTPELDAGAVIAQVRIPVLPRETPDKLAERLLPREHALMVAVLQLACSGALAEQGDVTLCHGQPLLNPLSLDSADRLVP